MNFEMYFTTQVFEAHYCDSKFTFVQGRVGFHKSSPIYNLYDKTLLLLHAGGELFRRF